MWDTVGALGIPRLFDKWSLMRPSTKYRFHDTRLGACVRHAYQAVAIDEWRSMRPVLDALRSPSGTLPIGYECLGAAFDAPADATSTEKRTVWRACVDQAKQSLSAGSTANGAFKLLGWLLAAMAGTMGAGYWFNLLTKAINIRSTGPKPDTQKR